MSRKLHCAKKQLTTRCLAINTPKTVLYSQLTTPLFEWCPCPLSTHGYLVEQEKLCLSGSKCKYTHI